MANLSDKEKEELEYLRYLELQEKEKAGTLGEPSEAPEKTPTQPLPDTPMEPTAAQKIEGGLKAFVRGSEYGASLGTAPALEAAASSVGQFLKGEVPTRPGTPEFRQKVMERAKAYKQAKEEYPGAFGVGEFGGTLGTGGAASLGAAKAGQAAAKLAPQGLKGLAGVGTEAGLEAGVGAGISALQSQDVGTGAAIGAGASVAGQAVSKVAKTAGEIAEKYFTPEGMRKSAIEAAPEALRPAATRMAESPELLEQARSAKIELERPGGLQEELQALKKAEEDKFKLAQKEIEQANKKVTAEYESALSEQDKAQRELYKETINAVKRAREKDANRLADAVDRGLTLQRQKASNMYDIAFKDLNDQVDPKASQLVQFNKRFGGMDDMTRGSAPETMQSLQRLSQTMAQDATIGAHTTGKEFKNLIDLDQSLASDLRSLERLQKREWSSNRQDAMAKLSSLKSDLQGQISSTELSLPEEVINQYNEAKALYKDFVDLRDELFKAKLVAAEKTVGGKRSFEPSVEGAAKVLGGVSERKAAKTQEALARLPGDDLDASAMSPAEFAELRRRAKTEPTLPQPPSIPKPELQPVPTQRQVTPEEMQLQAQIEPKQQLAQEFKDLSTRPPEAPARDIPILGKLVPSDVSPAEKLMRANRVEKFLKDNPNLSFALRVFKSAGKPLTQPVIQNLARQHQVDPADIQEVLDSEQNP